MVKDIEKKAEREETEKKMKERVKERGGQEDGSRSSLHAVRRILTRRALVALGEESSNKKGHFSPQK